MAHHESSTGAVVTCTVGECSYNNMKNCTASDIKVGEDHPACATFTTSGAKSGESPSISHVGGCMATDCTFNDSKKCEAPGITVTHHSDHADCGSYRSR
jgi:hypothetical protein